MIISDSWLQTDYGVAFGRFLVDNYKVVAVIDIATRVFPVPLIGACVILLEKESNVEKRMENNIVFVMLQPKKEVNVDAILKLIEEYSKKPPGSYRVSEELWIRVVPQNEVYESGERWIHYIFNPEELLDKLRRNPLTVRLSDYFDVSYGNILYLYLTSTGRIRGVRNVGGNEFFYLTEGRVRELGIPSEFLYPLLPSSRYLRFFTFTKNDWDELRRDKVECYLFLCHVPRDQLSKSVREYIKKGEGPNASIRLRRRPGEQEGRPVSESQASQERRRHPNLFYDWYDLGGVIPVNIFASYYAQYWHRFAFAPDINVALDADFMALILREGVQLTEPQIKALLAYLNSSIAKLYIEANGRSTGGGALALEAKVLNDMPVLNVMKLDEDVVRKLESLFNNLDFEARRLGSANDVENIFGSDLAKELTGEDVKPGIQGLFDTVIREIDYEVGRILGLSETEVEAVRTLVVDMARRRLSRAGEARLDLRRSEKLPTRGARGRRGGREQYLTMRLDDFFR